MPELPKRKVGVIACSGEEFPEGTVTRLAALRVLERLRPADTVTICLPLFLAGGEGDRAFARFYPTIAVDGCDKRCAARATEMYSGRPAASIVVTDLMVEHGLGQPQGSRRLNEAGLQAVEVVAQRAAEEVDRLLGQPWSRRQGAQPPPAEESQAAQAAIATCSCGSGIPVQEVMIGGEAVTLIALPLIFQQFRQAHRALDEKAGQELLETVRVYNSIPAGADEVYKVALLREYGAFCQKQEAGL